MLDTAGGISLFYATGNTGVPVMGADAWKGARVACQPASSVFGAEVVKLVYTLVSGTSGSNPVGVRVPPSAPNDYKSLTCNGLSFFYFDRVP